MSQFDNIPLGMNLRDSINWLDGCTVRSSLMDAPKIVFVVAFALLNASVLRGATREVGTGQTYATIQACEDAASPGDICNIHAATYTGTVTVSVASVTFRNNSGESPVLLGRFVVNSTPGVNIVCNNGGGAMAITAFGTSSISTSGVDQYGGTGLTVTGCVIHDGFGAGIYSRNSTKLTIMANNIYNNNSGSAGGNDGAGVVIISGHSTDGTYANGVTISSNTVHDNHVDGLQIHGQYFTVTGNTVRDNLYGNWAAVHPDGIQLNAGSADGYTSVQHAKFSNNVIKNHTQNLFLEGSAGAIERPL